MNYLDHLNPQQREAVVYCDGPQLVIAGAGSGKTRVLTYKIVHLLGLGFEPWRILALTFTNKAAREMRERIESLTGQEVASRLWMGTFHSIFARILRSNAELLGYKSSFTIYDAADSRALVKSICKLLGLDEKIYTPTAVQSAISWAKNNLISPQKYALSRDIMEADRRSRRERIVEVYREYCNRCRLSGAMDFDDLLVLTHRLFDEHPEVLRHYREFFRYVLVDEYQDTNRVQNAIVVQLTAGGAPLCVVGDDAQSIYSFRGANIRNILEMEQAFPGLRIFKLERNYRSTRNIIAAAGSLIAKNVDQIPKNVYSENSTGTLIDIVRCYSDFEEAALVAARVAALKHSASSPWAETAILYRTNVQSRVLEESLRKRNVPYRIYGGLSFYQRKEVKDAVAYFRLALNPDDDEALRRVINFPARGIGETTMNKLTSEAVDSGVSIWTIITDLDSHPDLKINAGTRRKLLDFASLIAGFNDLNASGADAYSMARSIIEATGLYSMLLHDSTPESISRKENLEELLKGAREYVDTMVEQGSDDLSLSLFMTEISLATDQDGSADNGEDAITLMTVHAAKGLEFDNVFIVGVEEELFPSARASDSPSEIEEERRLLYVAITRARRYCMISYASQRFRNGQTLFTRPSRFIGDIDPAYIHFSTGASSSTVPASGNYKAPASRSPRYTSRPMQESRRPLSQLRDTATSRPAPYATQSSRAAETTRAILSSTPAPTSASPHQDAPGELTTHHSSELKVGMRIHHSKFGTGLIEGIDTEASDHRITVSFDNDSVPTRVLMLKFARFAII